jgi:quaternary ammonium compound-resistance protein SugE
LEHWRGAIAFALPQSAPPLYRLSTQPTMKNEGCLMAWLFILMADVFEVAWPFALKWSVKFSSWSPLIVAIVSSIPVMFLLAEAVKRLPAATVYTTFVGIGVAGTAIISMAVFGESTNAGRICSLVFLLAGLIGLKLFSGQTE